MLKVVRTLSTPPALHGAGGDYRSTANALSFEEIWSVAFGVRSRPGERPEPVCLVASELRSGRSIRLWQDDLRTLREAPFSVGLGSLLIAFETTLELGCFLALGWSLPERVLDLFAEFRCQTNGLEPLHGPTLFGALHHYGLNVLYGVEDLTAKQLIDRPGPWSEAEREKVLDSRSQQAETTAKLLTAMVPSLDLSRGLLRGRAMLATARIEHEGVPIDVPTLERLRSHWLTVQDRLIEEIDSDYGVFVGRKFIADRWEQWLERSGIGWPRVWSGALALDDDTFREMARSDSRVALMRELRHSLDQLKLTDLAVGGDGRNRSRLLPFRSKTGRNQPSSSQFIFGPSTWLRGLIRPEPGRALAYVDWCQQEFGIAAALSQDPAMMDAYQSGDP